MTISTPDSRKKIALVCDFFYPRLGGVEMHIWSLAQHLTRQGHKVIIITHAYSCPDDEGRCSKRTGVRYFPGPLKVYYCPILPFTDQDTFPTFLSSFPLLRWIFIRERIEIVHAHQATSTLANESMVYAAELGLASVYTDHSLFGFDDVASLILNKVLKTTLSTAGAVICVSYTCRENLILRAAVDPCIVRVIPNAIDPSKFTPDPSQRSTDRIKIVVISRLVYRKGADLLAGIIPKICQMFPNVDFLIAGDGSKKSNLEQIVQSNRLQQRVEFLGGVPHSSVRDVLIRGHIFLNCSLTESFCIALLEASCCGLFSVSTNVGGVPEVLPEDMVHLVDPSVDSFVKGLERVIEGRIYEIDPFSFHERVKRMYCWGRVAYQTAEVYECVMVKKRLTFLQRMKRYRTVGYFSGLTACLAAITLHFWVLFVEWWQPREMIDVVPDLLLGG